MEYTTGLWPPNMSGEDTVGFYALSPPDNSLLEPEQEMHVADEQEDAQEAKRKTIKSHVSLLQKMEEVGFASELRKANVDPVEMMKKVLPSEERKRNLEKALQRRGIGEQPSAAAAAAAGPSPVKAARADTAEVDVEQLLASPPPPPPPLLARPPECDTAQWWTALKDACRAPLRGRARGAGARVWVLQAATCDDRRRLRALLLEQKRLLEERSVPPSPTRGRGGDGGGGEGAESPQGAGARPAGGAAAGAAAAGAAAALRNDIASMRRAVLYRLKELSGRVQSLEAAVLQLTKAPGPAAAVAAAP